MNCDFEKACALYESIIREFDGDVGYNPMDSLIRYEKDYLSAQGYRKIEISRDIFPFLNYAEMGGSGDEVAREAALFLLTGEPRPEDGNDNREKRVDKKILGALEQRAHINISRLLNLPVISNEKENPFKKYIERISDEAQDFATKAGIPVDDIAKNFKDEKYRKDINDIFNNMVPSYGGVDSDYDDLWIFAIKDLFVELELMSKIMTAGGKFKDESGEEVNYPVGSREAQNEKIKEILAQYKNRVDKRIQEWNRLDKQDPMDLVLAERYLKYCISNSGDKVAGLNDKFSEPSSINDRLQSAKMAYCKVFEEDPAKIGPDYWALNEEKAKSQLEKISEWNKIVVNADNDKGILAKKKDEDVAKIEFEKSKLEDGYKRFANTSEIKPVDPNKARQLVELRNQASKIADGIHRIPEWSSKDKEDAAQRKRRNELEKRVELDNEIRQSVDNEFSKTPEGEVGKESPMSGAEPKIFGILKKKESGASDLPEEAPKLSDMYWNMLRRRSVSDEIRDRLSGTTDRERQIVAPSGSIRDYEKYWERRKAKSEEIPPLPEPFASLTIPDEEEQHESYDVNAAIWNVFVGTRRNAGRWKIQVD